MLICGSDTVDVLLGLGFAVEGLGSFFAVMIHPARKPPLSLSVAHGGEQLPGVTVFGVHTPAPRATGGGEGRCFSPAWGSMPAVFHGRPRAALGHANHAPKIPPADCLRTGRLDQFGCSMINSLELVF